jgi:hypothetical protein
MVIPKLGENFFIASAPSHSSWVVRNEHEQNKIMNCKWSSYNQYKNVKKYLKKVTCNLCLFSGGAFYVDALYSNLNQWLDPVSFFPLNFTDFPDFDQRECSRHSVLVWFPYHTNGNENANKYGLLKCKSPLSKLDVLCVSAKDFTVPGFFVNLYISYEYTGS